MLGRAASKSEERGTMHHQDASPMNDAPLINEKVGFEECRGGVEVEIGEGAPYGGAR